MKETYTEEDWKAMAQFVLQHLLEMELAVERMKLIDPVSLSIFSESFLWTEGIETHHIEHMSTY